MIVVSHDRYFLNRTMRLIFAAEKLLEEKMERWMYLEDLAARIESGEEV